MPKRVIRHLGRVINTRLDFHNKALWYQQLALLEGKEFELEIKERKKKVTNDQYSYYYGGILKECFETETFSAFKKAADVHTYFEYQFLSYKVMLEVGDKKKEIIQYYSLSELGRKEMSEFIEKVIHHCREDLKIKILTPDEYYTENYRTIKR